jgi:hypothetical protein
LGWKEREFEVTRIRTILSLTRRLESVVTPHVSDSQCRQGACYEAGARRACVLAGQAALITRAMPSPVSPRRLESVPGHRFGAKTQKQNHFGAKTQKQNLWAAPGYPGRPPSRLFVVRRGRKIEEVVVHDDVHASRDPSSNDARPGGLQRRAPRSDRPNLLWPPGPFKSRSALHKKKMIQPGRFLGTHIAKKQNGPYF